MKKKTNGKSNLKQGKKSRHQITFLDADDLFVAFLGEIGWHTSAIAERTQMTECQVNYRLHKAGIKRKDYRNGESPTSELVVKSCSTAIVPRLKKELGSMFV